MVDALERAGQRDDFALVCADGQVVRAGQIQAWIGAAMHVLEAQLIHAGARVVYCGDQSVQAFVWFWACIRRGAIFVPIDVESTAHQYRWACERLAAGLCIVDVDDSAGSIGRQSASSPVVASASYLNVATPVAAPSSAAEQVAGDSLAACLLTSGSTGEPKVVMLSRDALADSAQRTCTHFGWQPEERLLNLPAPHTMSGLRNGFIAAPLGGLHWVVSPRRERNNVGSLMAVLERARAQHIVSAPVLIRQINLLAERVPDNLFESARALYCTGTDLNVAEVRTFHARFDRPVINYYGLTETVGLCAAQSITDWTPDDTSVGRPVRCEARVIDEELCIHQPLPMSGYWGDAEATAAAFDEGWFRTGDRARIDADGRIHLTGRLASFIKTLETEKVSPVEVEAILELHDRILEAAVCGISDRAGGERIAALLVVKNGNESSQLQRDVRRWVAERLGEARVPSIIRWARAIPRTANGKIQRNRLASYFDE